MVLKRNVRDRGASSRNAHGALLRGRLVCGTGGCAMTHSFTGSGSVRYRYYVCQQAMKRGWGECETRSVPAQEIEDFILRRIAQIGRDPNLVAEVARQAKAMHAVQAEKLHSEQRQIDGSLRQQARAVAGIFGDGNAPPAWPICRTRFAPEKTGFAKSPWNSPGLATARLTKPRWLARSGDLRNWWAD